MTRERWVRLIAGTFIMVSLALGTFVHSYWYFFTAFVGLNLFQSGFTGFCLPEKVLTSLNIGSPCNWSESNEEKS